MMAAWTTSDNCAISNAGEGFTREIVMTVGCVVKKSLGLSVLAACVGLVLAATPLAYAAPNPSGGSTVVVKFETPDGVPGLAELVTNKGAVSAVAAKPASGATAVQTLAVAAGVYKVEPRPVMSGGLRYVGVPAPQTVNLKAGATTTVVVTYHLSNGLQEIHATQIEATGISLAWTVPDGSDVSIRRTAGDVAAKSPSEGVEVAPTTPTTLVDTGLTPGTRYNYSVWVKPGDSAFGVDQANGPVIASLGTADPADPTKATYVATPGTVFAKPADIASAVPTGDGVALTLAVGVHAPAPGVAVLLPISAALRGGYLGVVTAVSTDGRTVTLKAGGLGDAFEFYQLQVDDLSAIQLEPADTPLPSDPQPAVGLSANQQKHQQAKASRKAGKGTATKTASFVTAAEAVGEKKCEPAAPGEGVDFSPSFKQAGHFNMTLDKHKVLGIGIPTGIKWDVEYAVTLSGAAKVDVKGGLSCSVDMPRLIAPISTTPVPISAYIEPTAKINISALLKVSNIGVVATLGFQTDGHVGFDGSKSVNGKLIRTATPLVPQIAASGASVGVEFSNTLLIGPGAGTLGAGVIVGLGGELSPLDLQASFTVTSTGSPCAAFDFAFKIGMVLSARAWLGSISFDATYDIPFLHATLNYPGSPFHWPTDCDKVNTPSDSILGGGVTKIDDGVTGSPDQLGYVNGFVPGAKTWVLSTGRISDAQGQPSFFASSDLGLPGDPALTALSGFPTYDAASYSVTVVPAGATLNVKYVFASEEYPEYVGSAYNDAMAVFVNGTNCAVVPGTNTPVSINTINDHTNSGFYVDNQTGAAGYATSFDGLTKPLTCSVPVKPGVPVTVRIAVADASDHIYDSAIALLDQGIWSA
jgi:hypothetical protein